MGSEIGQGPCRAPPGTPSSPHAAAKSRNCRALQIDVENRALCHFNLRLLTEVAGGGVPGPEAGLAKITTVLASFAAAQLAVDVGGPQALLDAEWGHQVSALPGLRSAGGTEEILRNVIGERVLGLPPEPRI